MNAINFEKIRFPLQEAFFFSLSAGFGAIFVMALFYLAGKIRKAVVGCCGRTSRKEPKVAYKRRKMTGCTSQPKHEVKEAEEALLSQGEFTIQASPRGSGLYIRRAHSSPALKRVSTEDDLYVSSPLNQERVLESDGLPAPP